MVLIDLKITIFDLDNGYSVSLPRKYIDIIKK